MEGIVSENAMMLAAIQPTMMATTSLGADVDELEKALSFFERMGKAALLPEGVKGPADALMLATAGHRLGFDLMTSLRAFHIIKGQVVLRADMMRAVVFAAGKRSGVDIHVVETSKARAVMVGVRNGREVCIEVTFEDAKAAGLTGSDTWKKYPAQMLVAAATRQLGRLLFPDLLAGIYTPDEMGQFEPPPATAEVAAFTRREPAARVVVDTDTAVIEGVRPASTVTRTQHPLERPAIAEPVEDAEVDETPTDGPADNRPLPPDVATWEVWWAYDTAQGKDPEALKTLVPKHARNRAEKLNRFLGFMRNGQGKGIGRPGILKLAELTAEHVPTSTIEKMLGRLEVNEWSELGPDHLAGFVAALLREREAVVAAAKKA